MQGRKVKYRSFILLSAPAEKLQKLLPAQLALLIAGMEICMVIQSKGRTAVVAPGTDPAALTAIVCRKPHTGSLVKLLRPFFKC